MPSEANNELYRPIIERYIVLEQALNEYFES
jgi:hypothetical protein